MVIKTISLFPENHSSHEVSLHRTTHTSLSGFIKKQADKYNYVYIVSICLFYFMCDKPVLLTFILLLPKPDLTGCGIHAVDYGK